VVLSLPSIPAIYYFIVQKTIGLYKFLNKGSNTSNFRNSIHIKLFTLSPGDPGSPGTPGSP
jgi:hypothetical protein